MTPKGYTGTWDKCAGCGLEDFSAFTYWVESVQKHLSVYCRDCHKPKAGLPDVFLPKGAHGTMYEENICDPETGKEIPFYDKASKAAAMKQAGIREAGDRVHGARNESNLKRKTYI